MNFLHSPLSDTEVTHQMYDTEDVCFTHWVHARDVGVYI